jgi:rod shape-determining protein MreD
MASARPLPAGLVAGSLVLAMALRILPLNPPWSLLNPDWLGLFLLYWILAFPDRLGFGTAWVTGLFADVLTGRMLGQHALAYSVLAYLALRGYKRLKFDPLPLQSAWVLLLLLVSQLLVLWTQNFRNANAVPWPYWLPALSGALAWPLVLLVLGQLRRRCQAP